MFLKSIWRSMSWRGTITEKIMCLMLQCTCIELLPKSFFGVSLAYVLSLAGGLSVSWALPCICPGPEDDEHIIVGWYEPPSWNWFSISSPIAVWRNGVLELSNWQLLGGYTVRESAFFCEVWQIRNVSVAMRTEWRRLGARHIATNNPTNACKPFRKVLISAECENALKKQLLWPSRGGNELQKSFTKLVMPYVVGWLGRDISTRRHATTLLCNLCRAFGSLRNSSL